MAKNPDDLKLIRVLPPTGALKKDWRTNTEESLRLWTLTACVSLGIGFVMGICVSEIYGNGVLHHFLQTLLSQ